MNTLRESLDDYLALRRALGFKLRSEGAALSTFVAFMEQNQADYISTARALEWAKLPALVQPGRWTSRLGYIRGLARYCSSFDLRTEVPPVGLLPFVHRRPTPYFFTDDDIDCLLTGAQKLPAKNAIVSQTFYCLFGLLSVSGLRICEALALTRDDIDLDDGIMTIRSSKFGKSRLVPLHATTVAVMVDYLEHRDRFLAGRRIQYWFVNSRGARLGYDVVHDTFQSLTAGMGDRNAGRRPHLHDLRHRFALLTLLHWYRDGQDIERRLPILSAFLGHVEVKDTYWYLSACPELMGAAKDRLEQRWGGRP